MFAGQQLTTGRSHKGADPADGDHCNIDKHFMLFTRTRVGWQLNTTVHVYRYHKCPVNNLMEFTEVRHKE